jgi:GT2 family glycosyltransferase
MVMQNPIAGNKPVISVCIANYNGINIIGPCIESVQNQTTDYQFEILVHDDASTDNSVAFIQSEFPDVKLFTSSENIGYCRSNNKLAEHALGEYLLFLNNDATLLPDAVQSLLDCSRQADNQCILGLPQYDMETGKLLDRGNLFDVFLNPVPNLNAQRTDVGLIIGACLWTPKTIWDEIGGFPDWFHTLTEDLYLCLVARIFGYDVKVLTTSGFRHWVGKSLGGGKVKQGKLKTTYKRRRLSERNKTYAMILCYPTLLLVIVLPIHLTLFAIEGIILSIIKRDWNIWSKIYSYTFECLWKEKKRIIKKRSEIQNKSKMSYKQFLSIFVCYPYKLKMLVFHGLPHLK